VNDKTKYKAFNLELLAALVRHRFVDIRMFGSAFAVKGFNRAMTGPIQLNWGYSLNPVYLMESNTISSIMNDDSSTFGKDYRVKYALLAFQGTMNKHAAQTTGLTETDIDTFRKAIWQSLSANPTRSKLNQYPKLYLEIVYNEGYHNGYFGDLRQLLSCTVKGEKDPQTVRQFADLELDLSRIKAVLADHTGEDKAIKEVYVQTAFDLSY
ncbi:MAG: type I-B CRISPR-associated protein Cas7/Csh2, partial [Bacteroidetes bacterium]